MVSTKNASAFGPDVLISALALCGKATPTPEEMAIALDLLDPGGMTVERLLAEGWMMVTIDGKRLREPPLTLIDIQQRLEAPVQAGSPVTMAAQTPEAHPVPGAEQSVFSYFRGGIKAKTPTCEVGPAELCRKIISGENRAKIEALRNTPADSAERSAAKQRLDYVTPAGIFTRRANEGLVTSSGLIVLDFDHLSDVAAARAALLADALIRPELVLLFVSPSGDGLKALLRTDPAVSHLANFRAYADYLRASYAALGLIPDESGKDVARACFVSHDPEAWLVPSLA